MAMILHEFDAGQDVPAEFVDEYTASVITPRNKLAHSKLFYGECKKKLHISKTRQEPKCNQDCEHCSSEYSIDSCEALRKKLFEYYQMFQDIDHKLSIELEKAKQP